MDVAAARHTNRLLRFPTPGAGIGATTARRRRIAGLFNMSEADFQLHGIRDPRLAVHATSAMPAWVWSLDGARILWANAAGARLFGARNATVLAERTIGAADPHRRQAAQLAARLPLSGPARLERLRGFGAPFGRLLTCSCTRLTLTDRTGGLLIAAVEPVGRPLPLTERLASLVDSLTTPAMIFTPGGALAGVNEPAKRFAALFSDLTGPGFDDARSGALRDGQATLKMDIGRVSVHRVGSADAIALVALIGARAAPKPIPKPTAVVVAPEADEAPVSEPVTDHAAPVATAAPAVPAQAESTASVPQNDITNEQPADVAPVDVFESVFDEVPAQNLQDLTETGTPPSISTEQDTAETVGSTQDNFPKDGFAKDSVPKSQPNPPVDMAQNVVPFPVAEPKTPALTAVESNAFDELARRLSAHLTAMPPAQRLRMKWPRRIR